jgi:hypothetical protein
MGGDRYSIVCCPPNFRSRLHPVLAWCTIFKFMNFKSFPDWSGLFWWSCWIVSVSSISFRLSSALCKMGCQAPWYRFGPLQLLTFQKVKDSIKPYLRLCVMKALPKLENLGFRITWEIANGQRLPSHLPSVRLTSLVDDFKHNMSRNQKARLRSSKKRKTGLKRRTKDSWNG